MLSLFYYFVYHGKVRFYEEQNPVLEIKQDAIPKTEYPNCGFWIEKQLVPHYAAYY